jgi:hypothetical protein
MKTERELEQRISDLEERISQTELSEPAPPSGKRDTPPSAEEPRDAELVALQRQLVQAEDNLGNIQERKSEYLLAQDIPLQLIRDERRFEEEIARLKADIDEKTTATSPVAQANSGRQRTWMRPVVLGLLISVVGVFGTYLALPWSQLTPTTSFVYDVNVENADTGAVIPNAQVTLRVVGQPPITSITDDNGFASLEVGSAYVGRSGELIIEADGFERRTQNVQLEQGALPNVVLLNPVESVSPDEQLGFPPPE